MKKLLFCFILLLPLTASCLRLEREYPEKESFSLEAQRHRSPGSPSVSGSLRVGDFRVASPFAGKSFVYRTGDLRYEEDYYHRFVARPAEVIAGQTVRWLEGAALFGEVYGGAAPVEPEYFLEGEVASLYGDYRRKPPRAVLEIAFTVARGKGVLLRRTYGQDVPLEGGAPEDLAQGWSRALELILTSLESDLRTSIERIR